MTLAKLIEFALRLVGAMFHRAQHAELASHSVDAANNAQRVSGYFCYHFMFSGDWLVLDRSRFPAPERLSILYRIDSRLMAPGFPFKCSHFGQTITHQARRKSDRVKESLSLATFKRLDVTIPVRS